MIILCECFIYKLKRDEKAELEEPKKKSDELHNLQNSLVQFETILDLLFMRDLSYLLTYCPKEFQRFDVLTHVTIVSCDFKWRFF